MNFDLPRRNRIRNKTAAAAAPAGAVASPPIAVFPKWARASSRALDDMGELEAGVLAGASLAALDAVVACGPERAAPVFVGALRARQALAAAARGVQAARLREDATALRDARQLTGPGATPAPAERIHRLFRLFGAPRFTGDAADFAHAGELLELRGDVAGYAGLVTARTAAAGAPIGAALTVAAAVAGRALADGARAEPAELLALWAADLALARRLGWARPLALLATRIGDIRDVAGRRVRPGDGAWPGAAARAYARAAADAHLVAVDLGRRAATLLAATPKLRARGAGRVVEMLLSDDGVGASAAARATGLSDRAVRRLFDRLVELGAARELTGRANFRIYGL